MKTLEKIKFRRSSQWYLSRTARKKAIFVRNTISKFSSESISTPTYCSENREKKAPEEFWNLFSTVKSNRKSIQRRTKGTSSRNDGARGYLRPHNYPFFPTYSGARLPSPIQWYVALGNDKLILVGWTAAAARAEGGTKQILSLLTYEYSRKGQRRRRATCRGGAPAGLIGGDLCGNPLISRFCVQHNKGFLYVSTCS